MSMSPGTARDPAQTHSAYALQPFDTRLAHIIAGWARTPEELFWLAPKTPPPLTAAKVLAWPGDSGRPLLLYRQGDPAPLGYCELNPMPGEPEHLWIGHCVIGPQQRGQGLGRMLVGMVLERAFAQPHVRRVSLVVFPENVAAIQCYRACGLLTAGEPVKYFHTTGRQHRMVQMTIPRELQALKHRSRPA
jgi:RimJ/RimL family protein N-acetyltransferase